MSTCFWVLCSIVFVIISPGTFSCRIRFYFVLITNLNANFGLMKMDVTLANKRMGITRASLIFPVSLFVGPTNLPRGFFKVPVQVVLKGPGQ